jgi:HSP20 family protein
VAITGLIPWNGGGSSLLDRLFEEPWRMLGTVVDRESPAVEVFERGPDVVVRAELAGIDPQDIEVHADEDAVTLRGQRRQDEQGPQGGYFHSERRYGAFVRTIRLPAPVDPARARARFRHGLLEVTVPRREDDPRHGRRVEVELQ